MKRNIVFLLTHFVFLDLIFAQEVKFDPEEATAEVGKWSAVRCYLEPATEADVQYHWYDKQNNEIVEMKSNMPKYIRNARPPQTGVVLYIKVADGDEGRYKCMIEVEGQQYEGFFQLNTYASIVVDEGCKDSQSGTKGEQGRIHCVATASTPLRSYWERDGAELDGSSGRYRFDATGMIILNVTDADKGDYVYVAEPVPHHPLISIMRQTINFDVYEAPVIEKPIMEKSGVAGGNLTLYCTAKGYPTVTFYWTKVQNEITTQIRDTERIKIARFGDQSQLQFKPVKKDDQGSYRCRAANAAGDAESSTYITVHTPPVIQELRNVTRVENHGAKLVCEAYGDPRPHMLWKRIDTNFQFSTGDQPEGKVVTPVDIGDVANPGKRLELAFSKLKHQDAGNYECTAENLAGKDSKIVNLEVQFGPNFDEQPDGPYYNWVGNADGHLPCVVMANPVAVFQWHKGDKEITSADPFFSIVREPGPEPFKVTSKLMITFNGQNNAEVFGDFKCTARNTINVTSRELTMTPAATPGPPVADKTRETATVLELTFQAQSVAGPPVKIFKAVITKKGSGEDKKRIVTVEAEYRDWADDQPQPRTVMLITNLNAATAYSLTLFAVNEVGEGTPTYMEHTTKALSRPEKVTVGSNINSQYSTSILVSWIPPDNGGSPILFYKLEYRQVEVKNTSNTQAGYEYLRPVSDQGWSAINNIKPGNERVTIQNLIPGKFYQVRVMAVNNRGTSVPDPLVIKTKDDPYYRPVSGVSRPVVSTIFTLGAAVATACLRSFL